MSALSQMQSPPPDVDEDYYRVDWQPMALGVEFEQFANILDDSLSNRYTFAEQKRRLLDLPQKYYDNAKRRLHLLRRPSPHSTQDDVDMDTDDAEAPQPSPGEQAELRRLEKEVQTWDLFRRVLPLRYSQPKFRPNRDPELEEQSLLQKFLDGNPAARERHAVVQWLQSNASSRPDIDLLVRDLQKDAGRDEIIAHGWLHTRAAIKQRKSVTGWPQLLDRQTPQIAQNFLNKDGVPMVTQLDPDVVSRQARHLEPQDGYFERAIWLGCFEHLRRGSSLKAIQEWCEDRTELWRAVSMSALPFSLDDDAALAAHAKPESLCLWRRTCLSAARNAGSDDYERAVYGLLSGEISTVEQVSKTWDDHVFASYNGLLRSQLDHFLLDQTSPETKSNLNRSFPTFDAVQYLGHSDGMEKALLSSLESRHQDAAEPNRGLQAAFLAKELGPYLAGQGGFIRQSGSDDPSQALARPRESQAEQNKYFPVDEADGLRTVAHIYLLHTILERPDPSTLTRAVQDADQNASQMLILAEYTKLLYRAGLKVLVPLYCSVLPEPACYEIMSESLIQEGESEQRVNLLNLIKKVGLSGIDFANTQAQQMYVELGADDEQQPPKIAAGDKFSILQHYEGLSIRYGNIIKKDFIAADGELVADKHERAIRGLEWLKDIDRTWPKIFELGTKLYKFFYRNMFVLAARELKDRVSFASVMDILTSDVGNDTAFFDDPSYWGELLEQSKISGSAEEVMKNARNFRELEALISALDNLETVGSMAHMSAGQVDPLQNAARKDEKLTHRRAPPTSREFWTKAGTETKNVRALMQPLLSSWLDAGIEDGDSQLKQIRQAYLPETILAYISALQFAGTGVSRDHLLEAMELASVLAAKENEGLIGIFKETGRMRELVDAFAGCSKVLAFATAEKRATGSGSKKWKELGWSRDLWSVKS